MSERVGAQSDLADWAARRAAVDPLQNVVLEASAGTGKTRVLVERYVNLLLAGVDPDNILAITFTRKAAAEMRERIITRLREASRSSELDAIQWRALRERLSDIGISTIDAFCLSLLREFPLEADVDPGFDLADDTEVARLMEESLDRALRISRALARESDDVALVFAQLGERRLRAGLSALLDRRLVAPEVLSRFLQKGPRDLTAAGACDAAAERLEGAREDRLAEPPVELGVERGVRGGAFRRGGDLHDGPTGRGPRRFLHPIRYGSVSPASQRSIGTARRQLSGWRRNQPITSSISSRVAWSRRPAAGSGLA